jgi:anti-sigma28 factor (negative regulator of flagellin synthesis)
MKLTNTNIETISPSSAGGAAGISGVGGSSSRVAGTTSGGSDSVNLSSASQLLSLAKASASSDRSAKVSSVAALVRSGQYSTDNASVSQAVVEGHIQ